MGDACRARPAKRLKGFGLRLIAVFPFYKHFYLAVRTVCCTDALQALDTRYRITV